MTPALTPVPIFFPQEAATSQGSSDGVLEPTELARLGRGLHLPEAPRAEFPAPAGPRPALFSELR